MATALAKSGGTGAGEDRSAGASPAAIACASATDPLSPLERRIVVATQAGLPLATEPFAALGRELGVKAEQVMATLEAMRARGVIRRIAAVPNHYMLGYRNNGMSVWDIADDKVHAAGALVGALDFVSHCYRRPRRLPMWPYNLFAMVHGRSRTEVEEHVRCIAERLGDVQRGHDVLYSRRILKKTGLRIHPDRLAADTSST